jgi:hypothetical protein
VESPVETDIDHCGRQDFIEARLVPVHELFPLMMEHTDPSELAACGLQRLICMLFASIF